VDAGISQPICLNPKTLKNLARKFRPKMASIGMTEGTTR
jgi:hypothetical protein